MLRSLGSCKLVLTIFIGLVKNTTGREQDWDHLHYQVHFYSNAGRPVRLYMLIYLSIQGKSNEYIHNFCFKQRYWYELVWNTAQSRLHISYSSWINILEGLPTSLMLLPWIQRLALCDSHFAEAAEILLFWKSAQWLKYSWSAIFSCFSPPRQLWTHQKDTFFPCKNVWISSLLLPCSFLWLLYHSGLKNLGLTRAPRNPKCLWQPWRPGLN